MSPRERPGVEKPVHSGHRRSGAAGAAGGTSTCCAPPAGGVSTPASLATAAGEGGSVSSPAASANWPISASSAQGVLPHGVHLASSPSSPFLCLGPGDNETPEPPNNGGVCGTLCPTASELLAAASDCRLSRVSPASSLSMVFSRGPGCEASPMQTPRKPYLALSQGPSRRKMIGASMSANDSPRMPACERPCMLDRIEVPANACSRKPVQANAHRKSLLAFFVTANACPRMPTRKRSCLLPANAFMQANACAANACSRTPMPCTDDACPRTPGSESPRIANRLQTLMQAKACAANAPSRMPMLCANALPRLPAIERLPVVGRISSPRSKAR